MVKPFYLLSNNFWATEAIIYYNHKQIKLYSVNGLFGILSELDGIHTINGRQSHIHVMDDYI